MRWIKWWWSTRGVYLHVKKRATKFRTIEYDILCLKLVSLLASPVAIQSRNAAGVGGFRPSASNLEVKGVALVEMESEFVAVSVKSV